MKRTNPAGRLYDILDRAKKSGQSTPAIDIWQEVLELKNLPQSEVFRYIGAIRELVDEVKYLIGSSAKINKALFLSRYDRIEAATNMVNLGVSWGNSRGFLDDATMLSLAHISEELSKFHEEKEIGSDLLRHLEEENLEIIRSIYISDMDEKLRILLLDELPAILRSLQEYRISGVKGMRKAVEQIYGALIIHHGLIYKENENEDLKKTLKFIGEVSDAVIAALNLQGIVLEEMHRFFHIDLLGREQRIS
jgi:hypothetical protein